MTLLYLRLYSHYSRALEKLPNVLHDTEKDRESETYLNHLDIKANFYLPFWHTHTKILQEVETCRSLD